ncbi:ceramide glucosyltransferase [Methylocapsa sp. S129]|uniref:ceramide glucosyltransferase n=1 Tax=Methylocapsa sp. S129 TaxID=1641869 RepID=UPI00131C63D9|nr:ceramide glucosyltransferase [Methylocapsa sp. S129]
MTGTQLAATFGLAAVSIQMLSALIAISRCAKRAAPMPPRAGAPAVSIVRPLCGIDPFGRETLASTFELDYPAYEILFCLADGDDPVAPIVRRLMEAHPHIPSRLLIGDDRPSSNPKLNNVVKGWKAAAHQWIVIADSNVLMPADYIQRLTARWRANTGIVCAPPIGAAPGSFAAEIECAFLNTYQARWQYAGEAFGLGFAQGKTMLWRRSILEAGGGIEALGAEIAEDAAATKLIHEAGLSAHLVDAPFEQPLGPRKWGEVWARQVRWARLRRATFPLYFAPELLTSGLFAFIAAFWGASELGLDPWAAVALAAIAWYGSEAALAWAAGWRLSLWSVPAWMARDLALPWLWTQAWASNNFVWRGNAMTVAEDDAGVAAGR